MLQFLFRRLTAEPRRGAALFESVNAAARQPHWYVEGQVPDTIDGRFAVLATLLALVLVRLERFGDDGNPASVALTERFIEVMEAEHRELGLGDPTLGKTVRKLVGSLARRTELWRSAVADEDWTTGILGATRATLYAQQPDAAPLDHSAARLRSLWSELETVELADIEQGRLG